MEDMKFLEEAVVLQLKKLVQISNSNDLPNYVKFGANYELDKLLEFASKNNFTLPIELKISLVIRGL